VKQLAQDLWHLKGRPPNIMNVYLMGDVLIDAATRRSGRRILRQVEGRPVKAHALTHAHPDHNGASKKVCETLGIPLWCGEADVPLQLQEVPFVDHPMAKVSKALFGGPVQPVDRTLAEGDEVAGFEVLHVPGHSPGHLAYWRESDRSLILGDVLFGLHPATGVPGLHLPPDPFTPDQAQNRESARRLAALEPALVCFGHGPPLRDTRKFTDFVAGLA
jgi:hydroxyacylglutathione hydrolase